MNPEQYTHLMDTLGDIKTSQGRIEATVVAHLEDDIRVHGRVDRAISEVAEKTNKNATSIARIRGIGAGVGGVFTLILAGLGLDRFGG